MLSIEVAGDDFYDEDQQLFIKVNSTVVEFEHSLFSLSKWESKHKKPFFTSDKTSSETLDYLRCMVISKHDTEDPVSLLTTKDVETIQEYINDPQTATWFSDDSKSSKSNEIITAEIIYYWLVSAQIPFECQYWHLRRLLTLIRVINEKNAPKKKMSARQIASRNRTLNAERRAKMRSQG